LQPMLDAAGAPNATQAPTDDEMQTDVVAHGVEPLFDGAALERI
jgi:hypothetical protein